MSTCPHCQRTEYQVKAGLTRAGSQRYLCKACQRKYTPEPKPMGYDDSIRKQALRMYLDGNNQWRIARQLGISQGPFADRMVVVANDGLHHKARGGGAWDSSTLQPAVERWGNHRIWKDYLGICEWLLMQRVQKAGYRIVHFDDYHCGVELKMTHFIDRHPGIDGDSAE